VEVRTAEFRPREVRLAKVCLTKVRLPEISAAEIRPAKVDPTEVPTPEVFPTKMRLAKVGRGAKALQSPLIPFPNPLLENPEVFLVGHELDLPVRS
jgi:hypothetical protein